MNKNKLKLIGSLAVIAIVLLSCRPKKRPQNVVGNSPTLVVSISGMSEFGDPNYSYHLSGTSCASVDGEILIKLHSVIFKDRKLKKGLGGCVLLVRGINQAPGTEYTKMDGVLWMSDEFVITQNKENKMVSEAHMEKVYKVPPDGVSSLYNLKVSMKLPKETEVGKFTSARGTLKCSEPVGEINKNDLKFDQKYIAIFGQDDIKMVDGRDTITCSELKVVAMIGATELIFKRNLTLLNSVVPVADMTMTLNGGNAYQLSLVKSSTQPTGTGINVNISQCPVEKPWLDTAIESAPVCRACPDNKPYYREVLQECYE